MHNRLSLKISLLLLYLFAMTAMAQAQSFQGEVQMYIFTDKGLPLEGVEMELDGVFYHSNSSGFLVFKDAPGTRTYDLFYKGRAVAEVQAVIREFQAIEILITLSESSDGPQKFVDSSAEDLAETLKEGRDQLDENIPTGTLSGQILHIESGNPVGNATLIFRGISLETVTDDKGRFSLEVPEGEYAVSVIHPDYSSRTLEGILIIAEEETPLQIQLTPSGITLDAVTVFASSEVLVQGGEAQLIEETKNSGVMLTLIGTEQMSKTGDSDAAAALGRVTGLTIVDGRYVFVRGMGERYSSSYLNGARLPSPEIDKRVVPLDLFPTSVLESLAVQKSYSPRVYGDFGGGTVELRTAGIPKDRYKRRLRTTISASIGYDIGSTFTEQLMNKSGKVDFLGIDDGGRDLPDLVTDEQVTVGSGYTSGMTEEQVEAIGQAMNKDWDGTTGWIPPDISLSFGMRDKIEMKGESAFGWNLSLLYKNGWDVSGERIANYSSVDPQLIYYDYDSVTTSNDIDLGGLLDMEYKFNSDFNVGTTTLLVRTTDNVIQHYNGFFTSDSSIFDVYNATWVESTLFSQRIGGLIGFNFWNNSELNWQYTFSLAHRDEPGNSSIIYEKSDNADDTVPYELYFRSNAAEIYFAEVLDMIHDASLQMEIPIFWFNDTSPDYLEFGTQFFYQDRTSDVRRFAYGPELGNDLDLTQDPDDILTNENIGEFLTFAEYTAATDNYSGNQYIIGGYMNADLFFWQKLRCNLGLRAEYSHQEVNTFNLFGGTQSSAVLEQFDLLPALNFTFYMNDKHQLRLGGSRTVNRPDLRELSDAPKYGVAGSGVFTGNPDLKRAVIWNADFRYEWYISENESLSAGVFYKYFQDAIELVNDAGAGDPTTLANVPTAHLVGVELDWRLSFRYISDGIRMGVIRSRPSPPVRKFWGGLSSVFRDMYTSGNFTYIFSEIDYQGNQGINTNEKRPLQGQSPWIINISLGYKNSVSWSQKHKMHTSINLNYNVFGPRISRIGVFGTPDYYDEPYHQLDLVLKQRFTEDFSIGFKFNNILDLPSTETVGGLVVNEERKGRSFSLSGKLEF